MASEAVTSVLAAAGVESVPIPLVQALIHSSPVVIESWGYVSASSWSDRVAFVGEALDKAFASGAKCPPGIVVHGTFIRVSDLLAMSKVARITDDASMVIEACRALPFVTVPDAAIQGSTEAASDSATLAAAADGVSGAGTGLPSVVVMRSPQLCQRQRAEHIIMAMDSAVTAHHRAAITAKDALIARYMCEVATSNSHECLPAAVLCAEPQMKLLKASPASVAEAIKGVPAQVVSAEDASFLGVSAGTVLVPALGPSEIVAAVYLGDGHDGEGQIGLAAVSRVDGTTSLGGIVATETETMLGQEAELADDELADAELADAGKSLGDAAAETGSGAGSDTGGALAEEGSASESAVLAQAADIVQGLAEGSRHRIEVALQFHLHPARLRYSKELMHQLHELGACLHRSALLSLPRVRRAIGRAELADTPRDVMAAALVLIAEQLGLVSREPVLPDEPARLAGGEPAGAAATAAASGGAAGAGAALAEGASLVAAPAAETVWVSTGTPWMRTWVPAPGAKTPAARLLAGSEKVSATHHAALVESEEEPRPEDVDGSNADASSALAAPVAGMARLVSNVGEDDSSLIAFERTGTAKESGTTAGTAYGDDQAYDDDEDDAALLERKSAGPAVQSAADQDVVVQRSEREDVADLQRKTFGCTPWQRDSDAAAGRFSMMSFNILADAYAVPAHYTYAPKLALSWGWRRSLIVAEVLFRRPSILAMQEVESWIAPIAMIPASATKPAPGGSAGGASGAGTSAAAGAKPGKIRRWGGPLDNKHAWFAKTMALHGYDTFYARKVKSLGAPMTGHTIGNALFWRKIEFECVSTQVVSIADEAQALYAGGEAVWERGFPQVAAVAHLRHRSTGREVLAAAMHLSSDYTQPGIQACQALALRVAMRRISAETGVRAVIIAGDANDVPDGPATLALRTARVSALMAKSAAASGGGTVPAAYIVANQLAAIPDRVNPALPRLVSAAKAAIGSEPPFTVASPQFMQTLDYIFVSAEHFVVEAALDGVPREHITLPTGVVPPSPNGRDADGEAPAAGAAGAKTGPSRGSAALGIPTVECPSDHLPVAAVLRFATKLQAKQAAAARAAAFSPRRPK
jgi:endonuclease/exonuclease/phosphatase family metal-dependent hydrolase